MLTDDAGRQYEPDELRSLYEGAFSKAFSDNPNRALAHEMFDLTFSAEPSSHEYLIVGRYSIPEEQSADYAMPATVEILAMRFAEQIWWRAQEAMGSALYFSFPRTERPDTDDFDAEILSECSSEKWDFLFLEDKHHIDLVTSAKDFPLHAAPEGFAIEGTKCYPLPEFPEGCALYLASKARFLLSNHQISLETPESIAGSYVFESSVTLHSTHQPDSFLRVKPSQLDLVWKDRYYPSQRRLVPDMSIQRNR